MIKKLIDSLTIDKKDHVLLGIILGFVLMIFLGNLGGLISIVLVGLKELVHDKLFKKGRPELNDFIASAVPIIMFLIIYNIK